MIATVSAHGARRAQALVLTFVVALFACGGDNAGAPGSTGTTATPCGAACAMDSLSTADVETIVAQAVVEAQAVGAAATIAVSDRVGNVLAVFSMPGAAPRFRIDGGRGARGGLEQVDVLPSSLAAISKALTGAYLSSNGNAFSSRTASQIVQENFNPQEANQPSGPLFGVQFSQLSCSDVMRRESDARLGPKRAPLGLSADPGGLPLYKNGRLVGGVGVLADRLYGLDLDIRDQDHDVDERLAVAATRGFEAPDDIAAHRITADGRSLRYVDLALATPDNGVVPPLAALAGNLVAVAGYFSPPVRAGVAYGTAESGVRHDTGAFATLGGHILVDANNTNVYEPRASDDSTISAAEAQALLAAALETANRSRAQIRRPSGSAAQVTVAVIGVQGEVLGMVRTPDAPVFGIDVALQKARSAALFSNPTSGAALQALAPANYLNPVATASMASYVSSLRSFLNRPTALSDGLAFSSRSIGNLARPNFPDGIAGTPHGPLSKPAAQWSVFNDGLQLDLAINALTASALGSATVGCTGLPNLKNGLQIFPGGFPLYRTDANGSRLVGAVGISGDGVDQDDMIAFLGITTAGQTLGSGLGHAPAKLRADTLNPSGGQLRYVQCPQAPFNNSELHNVCAGL